MSADEGKELWPCLTPDRARFAAREYVARVERESGETLPADFSASMSITYENGYLRGANDAHVDFTEKLDAIVATAHETGRLERESEYLKLVNEAMEREKALYDSLTESHRRELESLTKMKTAMESELKIVSEMKRLEARLAVLEAQGNG